VRLADAALYRAKAIGRGGVAVLDATAESDAAGRAALEEALRRAAAELKIGETMAAEFIDPRRCRAA
jgi:predicted signal transduction protein with EAL and GGDEF domain